MVYLLSFFELFSWLEKRFRQPVRPGHDDNYASEAMASSSRNDIFWDLFMS